MEHEEHRKALGRMVAKAWSDEAFKQRLLSDTHSVLAEAGVSVPSGITVKVVENKEDTVHLVLPQRPDGELSEETLDQVAAGFRMPGNYSDPKL